MRRETTRLLFVNGFGATPLIELYDGQQRQANSRRRGDQGDAFHDRMRPRRVEAFQT
jgi:hypothetical protein